MCGISGIINLKNPKPISLALQNMTKSMLRRGPDDEGYLLYNDAIIFPFGEDSIVKSTIHITETKDTPFKIGFGFRQLKIIDLSEKSHQPMEDLSKNFHIVFNGEIYNFKEIKNELIGLGHRFFSNSDTEVILNAYKQWKEKSLKKFNGMFALAIFDKIKNEIFIARDRMGIKPLYYFHKDDLFIFSSTIQAITDSGLYEPEINKNGLWQNFRFSIAQRPETSFKNIYALEAGHFLKINLNNNHFHNKQYWQIPTNIQDFSLSEEKSKKLIEESLFNAIKNRLVSDVEVGTFMSGGVDSTTVSAIASKLHPNIKALTLGFKEYKNFNEVDQAKDTAKLNAIDHCVQNISIQQILHNIQQIATAYDEPYQGISANYQLGKMASENKLKVVLSGLGGDELFGGYDVYNKLKFWQFSKKIKQLSSVIPPIHPKLKRIKQLAGYADVAEFYSHYYTLYTDAELALLFNDKYNTTSLIKDRYLKENIVFTDDFEQISFYNLKSYVGNHQLRAIDLSMMYFSVEGRIPMLDHNFIETAYKIPTKFKIKNNSQKFILKQVAKKHIAPSCLKMNKKGLNLPLKQWMQNELNSFIQDNINSLKSRQIFNNLAIESVLKSNQHNKIWQLVSTELWLQKFFDK